jgi:hypothetical protein
MVGMAMTRDADAMSNPKRREMDEKQTKTSKRSARSALVGQSGREVVA